MDLPDFECRCEIWKGVLTSVPLEGHVNISKLSEATEGYSGAEVQYSLLVIERRQKH